MKIYRRILEIGEKVLNGECLVRQEAEELVSFGKDNYMLLLSMADKVRQMYDGDGIDICSIYNARSGKCSENCAYCAQSKYHNTSVSVYPFAPVGDILEKAKISECHGANRFAIVTSGKGMDGDREFSKILEAVDVVRNQTNLKVCCSLGALNRVSANALRQAGVVRYHHNIETSREHYPSICTSHTYDDRLATVHIAKEAGMEVCSGGIIGMNESWSDRINMALDLRELEVESIPINILTPIQGTPLANQLPLMPLKILQVFAIFKLIAPNAIVRTAGGRESGLRDLQAMALCSGVGGLMVGGYLTTNGRSYQDDKTMLRDLQRYSNRLEARL